MVFKYSNLGFRSEMLKHPEVAMKSLTFGFHITYYLKKLPENQRLLFKLCQELL